ncbi:MAG: alpha-L-rhamnosidase C-terminal domain-containing protein, partial [Halobacteriaceae archaeon]
RHGDVESRWERTDDGLELAVTVPWNTTATVRVPAAEGDSIRLDGDTVWDGAPATLPAGVDDARRVDGGVAFDVTAGEYQFVVA